LEKFKIFTKNLKTLKNEKNEKNEKNQKLDHKTKEIVLTPILIKIYEAHQMIFILSENLFH
jgi:hypothetical protein